MAQAHLRRVRSVSRAVETKRTDLAAACLEANDAGESLREIAKHAGVSHATVAEMIRKAKAASPSVAQVAIALTALGAVTEQMQELCQTTCRLLGL